MYLPYQGSPPFLPIFSTTFRQGVVPSYYYDEVEEKTAIMPSVLLFGPTPGLRKFIYRVRLQEHGENDPNLTIGLVAVTGPERLTYYFKNDCLPAMPSAVACLGFILLFTIIFFINSLFFTKASLTARRYTTVYLIVDTIRSRIKGNTSAVPKMLRKFFIEISDSDMDVPLGIQHVTTQGSGGTLLNTQNASAQHGISVGLKTPPDSHMDRSAQSPREPWDPGFQRLIAVAHLEVGRRPLKMTMTMIMMTKTTSTTTLMSTLLRVLSAGHPFQQLSTKHKYIKHTRFLLSPCAIPRSGTKTSMSDSSLPPTAPLIYTHHLRKPRVGLLSLRICIYIGKDHLMSTCGSGSGETGGTWRPIQAGYSHPRLPGHQFQVLKSARPTWIMRLTWQKRYRRGSSIIHVSPTKFQLPSIGMVGAWNVGLCQCPLRGLRLPSHTSGNGGETDNGENFVLNEGDFDRFELFKIHRPVKNILRRRIWGFESGQNFPVHCLQHNYFSPNSISIDVERRSRNISFDSTSNSNGGVTASLEWSSSAEDGNDDQERRKEPWCWSWSEYQYEERAGCTDRRRRKDKVAPPSSSPVLPTPILTPVHPGSGSHSHWYCLRGTDSPSVSTHSGSPFASTLLKLTSQIDFRALGMRPPFAQAPIETAGLEELGYCHALLPLSPTESSSSVPPILILLGVGGPGQQLARPFPPPPHKGQLLVDHPLSSADVGGEWKRAGIATTATDSGFVIDHPRPQPGVGVEGLVGYYDPGGGGASSPDPDLLPEPETEMEGGNDTAPSQSSEGGDEDSSMADLLLLYHHSPAARPIPITGAEACELELGETVKRAGVFDLDPPRASSALGFGDASALDLGPHATEHALLATLTTRQQALDQRELGLAARQERIEGMEERVGEVQRGVGYREDVVGRRGEVIERREEEVEQREMVVERRKMSEGGRTGT
ncbi:uncharacterized protein LACBIDRAFT_294566 [Laccaria bicolor S238N-H82]|uniref:Predicted protein n=1 Tax=Laccaria bicolor (strain S238N-H82 / ATCC MYA-4686) TaxID=486041 RepID=B0DDX3_LACBS|nr:uncharacterized protein LACBIDRAFT_294566 [Laccaria bicolor S238N-H82]EDR07161.1 predicted protein [Laccaria bicolor S238N-H82]|eukprot:XP_001882092.1 predicted protein [Laccaria bicolor S238N-H82]